MKNAGELSALLTAMCWTVTALAFEASSKKVGSMTVNLLRLIAGFTFLSIFCWIYRGSILPLDASGHTWFILIISGLIGFTFGDLCLFQAFVILGARISMLLMALAPPITALIGWLFLGETMTLKSIAGMALTLTGIAIVVLKRPVQSDEDDPLKKKVRFSYPVWGILLGLGGAIGQATGLVLSKYGMHGYDPFASAQIRVIAGIGGFVIIYAFWNVWKTAYKALSNTTAMVQLSVGAFFGPFLGVSFSLDRKSTRLNSSH